ncbi:hypothetical protein LB505_000483 [Fusarium chuoi]|nr:hypothetical protein LB505_000483 [Fusarium chuoi]
MSISLGRNAPLSPISLGGSEFSVSKYQGPEDGLYPNGRSNLASPPNSGGSNSTMSINALLSTVQDLVPGPGLALEALEVPRRLLQLLGRVTAPSSMLAAKAVVTASAAISTSPSSASTTLLCALISILATPITSSSPTKPATSFCAFPRFNSMS